MVCLVLLLSHYLLREWNHELNYEPVSMNRDSFIFKLVDKLSPGKLIDTELVFSLLPYIFSSHSYYQH